MRCPSSGALTPGRNWNALACPNELSAGNHSGTLPHTESRHEPAVDRRDGGDDHVQTTPAALVMIATNERIPSRPDSKDMT